MWRTLLQSLRQLPRLLLSLQPTWHLESLHQVTPAFLLQNGVRGIIWDVDGTLTGHGSPDVHAAVVPLLTTLLHSPLRHVILSNSPDARVRQLCELFPDVPVLRIYRRGATLVPVRTGGDDLEASEALAKDLLGQGARAVRKPHEALTSFALQELGLDAASAVMIGDQYFTDVAGANLAGVRSIKLPTLAPDSFPSSVRLAQGCEAVAYRVIHGRRIEYARARPERPGEPPLAAAEGRPGHASPAKASAAACAIADRRHPGAAPPDAADAALSGDSLRRR